MNKLLYADSAGHQMQKLYGQSHVALAALVPASLLSPKDSIPATLADVGLSVAIPFHSQVALNYVVSDYVPRMLRLPARVGVLGLSCVMFAGLMKTSLTGPGIGGALKELWKRPQSA